MSEIDDYMSTIENAPVQESLPDQDGIEGANKYTARMKLPPITFFSDVKDNLPELAPELIKGILRQGHKLLVSSSSKAGKSFLLIELAVAIAEGRKWLKWDCKQGCVLYINLEIDTASFMHRVNKVYEAMGITDPTPQNLILWSLRGKQVDIDTLVTCINEIAKKVKLTAVIIDPIYKELNGDENNASDMAQFVNHFDELTDRTGASVMYAHHHSKGAQGQKSAMDRASGSGVFARDPDALLDLTEIEPKDVGQTLAEYETAWRVDGVLREFPKINPFEIVFSYPLHRIAEGLEEADYKTGADPSTKRRRGSEASRERAETRKNLNLNQLEHYFPWAEHPDGITFKEALQFLGDDAPELKTFRKWIDEGKGIRWKIELKAGTNTQYIKSLGYLEKVNPI